MLRTEPRPAPFAPRHLGVRVLMRCGSPLLLPGGRLWLSLQDLIAVLVVMTYVT
jgi:hypothetical protein